jgi:hypothetical protein
MSVVVSPWGRSTSARRTSSRRSILDTRPNRAMPERSPRQLLSDYVSRRSPWGPPWWIYGVTYGAANLVRQVVIIAIPAEVSTPVRIASWVVTALLVIGVINTAAAILRRGTRRHDPRTHARPEPRKEAALVIAAITLIHRATRR